MRSNGRRDASELITTDPKDVSIVGEVGGDNRIDAVRWNARREAGAPGVA
jgi:hypothetical protein